MEHLNSIYFSFHSVGDVFDTNLEHEKSAQVQIRLRYSRCGSCQVDGSALVLYGIIFTLLCVVCKSLLAPSEAVCVQCLMLALNPQGKSSRPKALPPWLHCVFACKILNQVETVFPGTCQYVETWVRTQREMNVSLQAAFGSLKRIFFIIHWQNSLW